jgi:hypothetical protein
LFIDVWEGLNVRLATSEGGRPLWSGQMSMPLIKLDWNTLQVEAYDHRLLCLRNG